MAANFRLLATLAVMASVRFAIAGEAATNEIHIAELQGTVEVDEAYWGGEEAGMIGRQTEEKALIVVAAEDASTAGLYAAVWDDALAPTVAPTLVAPRAHAVRIVADGDGAWVVWARYDDDAVQYARLGPDGAAQLGPAIGVLDTALPHYHMLQRVDGSTVVIWLDVAHNRSYAATRLCL